MIEVRILKQVEVSNKGAGLVGLVAAQMIEARLLTRLEVSKAWVCIVRAVE